MEHCADCGFLSFRNPETHLLEEVERNARKTGHFRAFDVGARTPEIHRTTPQCFAMAFELSDEVEELLKAAGKPATDTRGHPIDSERNAVINLKVIEKDRQCRPFVKWQQGFSPKEHKIMLQDIQLRKWEEDREERNRKWNDAQKKSDRKWQLLMAFLAAIFSLVTGLIGLYVGKTMNPNVPPVINIVPQKDGVKVEVPNQQP